MSHPGLTTFVVAIVIAMILVASWRKVLPIVCAVAIAVFFYGLIYVVGLLHV